MHTAMLYLALGGCALSALIFALLYFRATRLVGHTRRQLEAATVALREYERVASDSAAASPLPFANTAAFSPPSELSFLSSPGYSTPSSFGPIPEQSAPTTMADALAGLIPDDTDINNALMATRDGLWDWDRSSDSLVFNARFLGVLGYSIEEFPPNQDTWRQLLHPEDRHKAERRQQHILDSPDYGDNFEHMFRLRASDGSYRWFLGQILHVDRDETGRATRVVGANVDITDLKELQAKVEARGADLNCVLASTCDKVWEWDVASENAVKGYDEACLFTMLGRNQSGPSAGFSSWAQNIHPDDRDLAVALQMRIIDTPENGNSAECTYRYKIADASYRWMLGRTTTVQRDEKGRGTRIVGVHTDVTELKSLRSELEVRSERLHYAFAAARDGLWDWDVERDTLFCSPRYLTMLGYDAAVAPTQSFWEAGIHPEDKDNVLKHQHCFSSSPAGGDSFENTYRFKGADGNYRWILARALVVRRDAQGCALRIVGLHTDITEMRRTQESLRILLQHDSLTGLHSRAYFEARLKEAHAGTQDPLSLIIFDVDGLKLVNDTMGHSEGDRLLMAIAGILRKTVRSVDIVARIGGDEIAVLLPQCSQKSAQNVVQKCHEALAIRNESTATVPLFFSVGCATADLKNTTGEKLFHQADSAMLHDKAQRRHSTRAKLRVWLQENTGQLIDTQHDDRVE